MRAFLIGILFAVSVVSAAAQNAMLRVEVRGDTGPIRDADIVIGGVTYKTDAQGLSSIVVAPGRVEIVVVKKGFAPTSVSVDVQANQQQPIAIALVRGASVEEHVTVSATRTDRGLEDQPLRVELLDHEEIEEKLMMTPGDIVMMLNEMGGMRVQATSPSLGAASVRIQGMRGRYTRFLSDGLPLFGEQVSLGLMQIPPLDLGRVEVIKGVASSLYGSGAMSGVVNLVAKRPGAAPESQLLVNRSSRGATDIALWHAAPLSDHWGFSLLGSANGQQRTDVNGDGWADLPKYARGVVRPRLYWDTHTGSTLFATAGFTWEDRIGGAMPGVTVPAAGHYIEALETRRSDVGAAFQTTSANGVAWSARGSWSAQHQDHAFGDVTERDAHDTGFAELTVRRAVAKHTLVAGIAVERDNFRPVDTPRFAYTFTVPGIFVQDDVDVTRWLAVSASARVDRHSEFGTFVSPRLAGLLRHGPWSSRLSFGTGFFAPTPITEETESAGLSRLNINGPLKPERGRSASFDVTRTLGPVSTTLTLFHSSVTDPVEVDRAGAFSLANLPEPTTNTGIESLTVWKTEDFSLVASYVFVRSRETSDAGRVDVPLTPRHSIGLDGAWEWANVWRLGAEWYYTGAQRLEGNPYRDDSRPYSVFGVLATRQIGHALLFINGENLTDVRQTRWDPLIRPTRGIDGRWTVDAWGPLDGRNINAGVRFKF